MAYNAWDYVRRERMFADQVAGVLHAENFKQLSPAYQFQMQQGQQGVLNGDASGQGALSGAAMKDLIGYNQNMANTSLNNAFNQYQTQQRGVGNLAIARRFGGDYNDNVLRQRGFGRVSIR